MLQNQVKRPRVESRCESQTADLHLKCNGEEWVVVHQRPPNVPDSARNAGQTHGELIGVCSVSPSEPEIDEKANTEVRPKECTHSKARIISVDRGFHWTSFGYFVAVERVDMVWVDRHRRVKRRAGGLE